MVTTTAVTTSAVSPPPTRTAYDVAAEVPDPELPQLTLADLGILRSVEVDGVTGAVVATITPTYSGCPAMREIGHDVRHCLEQAGYGEVEVRFQLAPAWSTAWITDEGRRKLHAAGIAPPGAVRPRSGPVPLTLGRPAPVTCPRCGADDTRQTAAFSGTACKSLHRCVVCDEPFEAVKPL